jgi:hypothetical protein
VIIATPATKKKAQTVPAPTTHDHTKQQKGLEGRRRLRDQFSRSCNGDGGGSEVGQKYTKCTQTPTCAYLIVYICVELHERNKNEWDA